MDNQKQFETIALLQAYAKVIVAHDLIDLRPSSAKRLLEIISRMHNLKDQLEIRS